MSVGPSGDPTFAASAALELAQLRALVETMKDRLAALHQDVADAESRLGSTESAQLVEANEQLVLAAMRSEDQADTAAQAFDAISRTVNFDALTGLPNRVMLLDRLGYAIANARRRKTGLALLFLDLNDFKQINDTLGHAVGDRVLKLVADRLVALIREADTVGRLGGDEFVFLLSEVTDASAAVRVADKLLTELAAPSRIDDHVLRLTASIGISLFPEDGTDAATLLDHADMAMYRAKRHGLGSVVFHDERSGPEWHTNPPAFPSLQRPAASTETVESDLERENALLREANEQLVLTALGAKELYEASQQAHRRQSDFLAKVAHELRGPLAPIRIAVAVLGKVAANEPEVAGMKAVIERQLTHMTRLVGDLSGVTRIDNGKFEIRREHVDLRELVDAAIHVSRPAMDARLQTFVARLPASALQVDGDPVRLVQVLGNLLDNASKYTGEGGEVRLVVEPVDEGVQVTVSDTGIGISAEALPEIFQPFFQDPHAVAYSASGLGLGLTVVRELVQAHGGTVVAHSAGRGFGSQFVVILPLA